MRSTPGLGGANEILSPGCGLWTFSRIFFRTHRLLDKRRGLGSRPNGGSPNRDVPALHRFVHQG